MRIVIKVGTSTLAHTGGRLNIRRTELAKHLLAHEEDTILSIALRCGFNNTANFNRIFKAVVSTTPREYRKAKKAETLS